MKSIFHDFTGAFADGALLFPLVMTLSLQNGMDLCYLLLSSGLAYLVAGFVFRVPMPVQPLKSIAIAGLSVGASASEIRTAAVVLGLVLITGLLFDLDSIAKKVPERLIHGVQVGLGCLLVLQGIKYSIASGTEFIFPAILIVISILFVTDKFQYPILGLVASIGFFSSLFWLKKIETAAGAGSLDPEKFRPLLIVSLVLPQIVLTSANSVLATVNVSQKLFGERAGKVRVRRLVGLIGLGNILSGLIGGLPFCHGSGGVTAHHKGGARTNRSNYFIGTTLLVGALAVFIFGNVQVVFAPLLLGVLLMTVGLMHVALARASWSHRRAVKFQLVTMALVAVISGNMFWVLGSGLVLEGINKIIFFILERRQYD
jgi:hypothetical protein